MLLLKYLKEKESSTTEWDLGVSYCWCIILMLDTHMSWFCTDFFTMLYLVSYFSATPARVFWKLLYAEKCGFNLQIFNLSTGPVAIFPWPLSSHIKSWQKDVHTKVFLNAQSINNQGIFSICSSAFRFALSCADGLTVVHLKMDLAKASL